MIVKVRYSTKKNFSKYIDLDKPVTMKEALNETKEVTAFIMRKDTSPDLRKCEQIYYQLNIDPNEYVDQANLKKLKVGHTSMSIGDICVIGESWYQVMPIGFEEIKNA
jgi:hypothetical protein